MKNCKITQLVVSCLTVLCLSFGIGLAQQTLSLENAIALAMQNRYELDIQKQQYLLAQNNNSWGNAGRLPTVDALLNFDNSYVNSQNPASFFTELQTLQHSLTPALQVNWQLYDGGRSAQLKAQLEKQEQLALNGISLNESQLKAQVSRAYLQVLVQKEQINVLRELLRLSRDRLSYQKVRADLGQAGTFERNQANDAYLTDSIALLNQITTYTIAYRQLLTAMGIDEISTVYTLISKLDDSSLAFTSAELLEQIYSANLELQNLSLNRDVANLQINQAKAAQKPQFGLSGLASYNYTIASGKGSTAEMSRDFDAIQSQRLNYALGLAATYRIYDGENRKRLIENAEIQADIAQLRISDLKRQLQTQLFDALETYQLQRERVELTESLMENARQNISLAEERFKGGQINSFDYRAVQLTLLNASQVRLQALLQLRLAEIDIKELLSE